VNLALVAGRGHYEAVVKAAMNAERSLWIATANLKELMVEDERARPGRRRTASRGGEFRSMLAVLAEQVGRGVEVRILHVSPPSGPFREDLRRQPTLRRPGGGAFALRLNLAPMPGSIAVAAAQLGRSFSGSLGEDVVQD